MNTDNDNIVIDTIKKAEDNDAYNKKISACLKFGFDIKQAYVCDLLENIEAELDVTGYSVNIDVINYEIITLRLVI